MSLAYARPFVPIDFASQASAVFPLGDMIEQLRAEEVYETANRNALTLVHGAGVTAVLTVARAGAQCEEHLSPEPTIFLVLEGALTIESASDAGTIRLPEASAGALAPGIRHMLTANTNCAYLLVMGHSTTAVRHSADLPVDSDRGGASAQRQRLAASADTPPR